MKQYSPNWGRRTRRFLKLRAQFRHECEVECADCWLCNQPVDYALVHPHPDAWTLDHYYPLSTHPEFGEDPGNFRPAHASCNDERGARKASGGLGRPSRVW